jgi:hypothetical protein
VAQPHTIKRWLTHRNFVGGESELTIDRLLACRVAQMSSVVASVAHQFAPPTAKLSVFRYDQRDFPTPINHDEYDVWLDLGSHPKLNEMIVAASTEDNAYFLAFCKEIVFFS